MLQASDLLGIHKRGVADRAVGLGLRDDPLYFSTTPIDTPKQLLEWADWCTAWASGWLEADGGRDEHVQALLMVRYW